MPVHHGLHISQYTCRFMLATMCRAEAWYAWDDCTYHTKKETVYTTGRNT